MSNIKLGFKLSVRKFKNKAIAAFNKADWTAFVNLFLAITSTIIAILAYYLTLSDTNQQKQISNQKTQIDAMFKMVNKLDSQLILSKEQAFQMSKQTLEIQKQEKILIAQMLISKSEQQRNLSIYQIKRKTSFENLYKAYSTFSYLVGASGFNNLYLHSFKKKTTFFNKFIDLLLKEQYNDYLMEFPDAHEKWNNLIRESKNMYEVITDSNTVILSFKDGERIATLEEKNSSIKARWTIFYAFYFKFEDYIYTSVIYRGKKEFKIAE